VIDGLLDEVEAALDSGLYRVALLTALTIPDIAGALDAPDGVANGARYVAWFDTWAAPRFERFGAQVITGEDCYQYRCVLLHQGRGSHPKSRYRQSIFVLPKAGNIMAPVTMQTKSDSVVLDVPDFCRSLTHAASDWLDVVQDSALFRTNSEGSLGLLGLSFEAKGHAGPART
jgi:hypothetical protein